MNNFDPMNTAGYNYGNPTTTPNNSWGQPRQFSGYVSQPQPQPQFRLSTNMVFVTSLEEALVKATERNSDMVYFHQDKNEFYRVKVDMEGRKSWAAFPYSFPNQDDNVPATKADILELLSRIEALEAESVKETKVAPKTKKKEVTENAELNG